MKEDMVGKYFMNHMNDYTFIELMPDFIQKSGMDFMRGVPVPVKKEAIGAFAKDKGLRMEHFVMSMVMVIGMDSSFKYAGRYTSFLRRVNKDIFDSVMTVGVEFANAGNIEMAAIHFRAALVLNEASLAARYNYIMACRQLYPDNEDKEFVAAFKLEVIENLETITREHPDFSMGYYYLGFSYLNAGQYSKAKHTWESFMEKSAPKETEAATEPGKERNGEERAEIRERLTQLEEPVKIEAGYNDVIAGRVEAGLKTLESYIGTKHMQWWPLPYYLGIGYSRTERYEEAIAMFKEVLKLNTSSPETMAELAGAYRNMGDEINAEKYQSKFNLLSDKPE